MVCYEQMQWLLGRLEADGIPLSILCNSMEWQVLDKNGDVVFASLNGRDIYAFLNGYLMANEPTLH